MTAEAQEKPLSFEHNLLPCRDILCETMAIIVEEEDFKIIPRSKSKSPLNHMPRKSDAHVVFRLTYANRERKNGYDGEKEVILTSGLGDFSLGNSVDDVSTCKRSLH